MSELFKQFIQKIKEKNLNQLIEAVEPLNLIEKAIFYNNFEILKQALEKDEKLETLNIHWDGETKVVKDSQPLWNKIAEKSRTNSHMLPVIDFFLDYFKEKKNFGDYTHFKNAVIREAFLEKNFNLFTLAQKLFQEDAQRKNFSESLMTFVNMQYYKSSEKKYDKSRNNEVIDFYTQCVNSLRHAPKKETKYNNKPTVMYGMDTICYALHRMHYTILATDNIQKLEEYHNNLKKIIQMTEIEWGSFLKAIQNTSMSLFLEKGSDSFNKKEQINFWLNWQFLQKENKESLSIPLNKTNLTKKQNIDGNKEIPITYLITEQKNKFLIPLVMPEDKEWAKDYLLNNSELIPFLFNSANEELKEVTIKLFEKDPEFYFNLYQNKTFTPFISRNKKLLSIDERLLFVPSLNVDDDGKIVFTNCKLIDDLFLQIEYQFDDPLYNFSNGLFEELLERNKNFIVSFYQNNHKGKDPLTNLIITFQYERLEKMSDLEETEKGVHEILKIFAKVMPAFCSEKMAFIKTHPLKVGSKVLTQDMFKDLFILMEKTILKQNSKDKPDNKQKIL